MWGERESEGGREREGGREGEIEGERETGLLFHSSLILWLIPVCDLPGN